MYYTSLSVISQINALQHLYLHYNYTTPQLSHTPVDALCHTGAFKHLIFSI